MNGYNHWRYGLKAGDEVFVSSEHGKPAMPATIKKITRTQIVVDFGNYERRFRIKDGCEVGGNVFYRSLLWEPTDKLRDTWEVYRLQQSLTGKLRDIKLPKNLKWLRGFSAAIKPYLDAAQEAER